MPELLSSMALAGVDGTMKKRLRGEPVQGRAHIKTGSLNHVSAMAGYVLDRDGRRWAVALLINHKGLLAWEGKQVQDALIRWVYDGSPSDRPLTRIAEHPKVDGAPPSAPERPAPSG
jgi:D-alanyl-D-alanine carboxypeptidase/D-alanyl-D-alanine-endopeptidase (penicillin-binding protein 4)